MSQCNMHPNVNNNINDRSDNKSSTHTPSSWIVTATRFNSIAIGILHLVAKHKYTHKYICIDRKSVFASPWYLSYTQTHTSILYFISLAHNKSAVQSVPHCHHVSMFVHTHCVYAYHCFLCCLFDMSWRALYSNHI